MGKDQTPQGTPGAPDAGQRDTTEPAARRERARRPTLAAAAVAVAVLLAGGGGAYLVSDVGDGDGTAQASGPPRPLTLDGYPLANDRGEVAPGEPSPGGEAVRFQVRGSLPEGPEKAKVYQAKNSVSKEAVARLAKALEVSGTPRLTGGLWRVGGGPHDNGPSLQVNEKAPGDWSFSRRVGQTDCETAPKAMEPSTGECVAKKRQDPSTGGDPVSEEEARRAAEPVLAAGGIGEARVDATQTAGALRVVSAEPERGGLPSLGWATSVEIGQDGPVSGHGRLAGLTAGDEYPVVNAKRALELLERGVKPTFRGIPPCVPAQPKGPKASAKPVPPASEHRQTDTWRNERIGGDEGARSREGDKARILPCVPPAQGGVQEVRKAEFGLSSQSVRGTSVLVPSWLFTVAPKGSSDHRVIAQVAVDPKHISKAKPPAQERDRSTPSDRDSEPGAPREGTVPVESYSVNGRALTVWFWGGVCSDYSVSARESRGKVTVKVTAKDTRPGKVCIMIAKEFDEKVKLSKRLGDRQVVDAASGDQVPTKKP